ncbi:sugar kinase [Reyranella sp. CPCC 100927]|uniref:sugar kinase n=1 Tax=Reyranella sp. CPCC 100927 TaxID=2599616 RepID=UPI0011B4D790|nr:sugar kinase [Reyranella sp. CPCC 100927]TWT10764.1 sugar kinase [Reyranella sp. CPCC 100927]
MATEDRRIVLVTRPTRLDDLVARFNTERQAQFYVERLGTDFGDYLAEHGRYHAAVAQTTTALADVGRVQRLERRFLPNFVFGPHDLIVVLGQDGLVANTLKYLDTQSVVGVNPDPARWDGVLLPFTAADVGAIAGEALAGRRPIRQVVMAQASLNTGQTLYGVNDLFIGPRSHTSARYTIRLGDHEETQSSSGVIVSTGLGSSGWLKSVYAGWRATTRVLLPADDVAEPSPAFPWDAERLHFAVREPFPSRTTSASIVFGRLEAPATLTLVSQTPENGVIFSDGIEADYLEFNSGVRAEIGVADKRGHLVV